MVRTSRRSSLQRAVAVTATLFLLGGATACTQGETETEEGRRLPPIDPDIGWWIDDGAVTVQCEEAGLLCSPLQRPPALVNLWYPDGKFVAHCDEQHVCVTFKDPDGDPIEIVWNKQLGLEETTYLVEPPVEHPDGSVTQCARIDHAGQGMVLLETTAFDLIADAGGDGWIRIEDFYIEQSLDATSHESVWTQAYGAYAATCACEPHGEICDGVDNDCDGEVDEGLRACACTPGSVSPCYYGPPRTAGVGICQKGVQVCEAGGSAWGACDGQVLPSPEVCGDELDNDCDGSVDNGCP
jgi:hypothetical protein